MSPSITESLPPILERNLRALQDRDPDLVERLLWPVDMTHLDLGNERPPTYRLHFEQLPLLIPDDEIAELVRELPDTGRVLLFGLGLGDIAVHLVRTRPELEVIAWDRDPSLLRATLTRRDLSIPLSSGRLRLCMGADLIREVPLDHENVLYHPVLGQVYMPERTLLEEGLGPRRVALGLGGFVVNDVADALRSEGYSVIPLELSRWSSEELSLAVDTIEPELIVSVNYMAGLAEFCDHKEVPLVVWQVDAGTSSLEPCATSQNAHVFTFRSASVEAFQQAGFEHVDYLPVAAHTKLRHRMELDEAQRERYASRLTFVGSSLIPTAIEYRRKLGLLYGNWHPDGMDAVDELEGILERMLAEQRQDFSHFLIPELFEQHLSHFAAAVRRAVFEDPAMLVGEIAASEQRRSWVSQLGPLGIEVWGDEPWREVETSGARYRGNAGRREELTAIYNGTDVNVDIGRLYQQDTISQRVFDVLGCGGFLIAEHSPALEDQFEIGTELVTYTTIEELEQKVRHYLDHPEEAEVIAAKGLEAVRQRHTIERRVQRMLGTVTK